MLIPVPSAWQAQPVLMAEDTFSKLSLMAQLRVLVL